MPIVLFENIPFVVSRSEFLSEYKKLDIAKISAFYFFKGFDLGFSIAAITEIFIRRKEQHKNDFNSRFYSFNYYGKDAQDIAMEILLFFSAFYFKLKILDSDKFTQDIKEYILPHKKFYFKEESLIEIQKNKMSCFIKLNQIQQIKGLVNDFVICTDSQLIHFYSDVMFGRGITIKSVEYSTNSIAEFGINDFDYVLERNMPSKHTLWRYRKKKFLFIIQ